ncbi:MAG: biopolymer transporter ExbD [Verrucomicrobiota bacterium]
MARHSRAEALEEDEPELNISSLIDICFLLLIYFLVTTTIKAREQDVDMSLPSVAPSEEIPELKPLFIKVDGQGIIFVNAGAAQERLDEDADMREVPLLASRLDNYANMARATGEEPLVQVYVDGDASHQRVIDVLNALKGEKITKVTFTDLVVD